MRKRRNGDSEDNGFARWGGYMAAKQSKLLQQFSDGAKSEAREGNIFANVAIHVNGYTRPTAEQLKQIMAKHGGMYHLYESSATTHVIASNLPDSKVRQLKADGRPVVRAQWVVDSVAAGRLLDHREYLLYPQHSPGQALLTFPRIRGGKDEPAARLASDDGFLDEFYTNSRLHHISTMGATFKQYVGQLRASAGGCFPGLERLRALHETIHDHDEDLFGVSGMAAVGEKVVMHVDMDCFFVSVGLRSRPHLKGLPVAVTHAKGNPPAGSGRGSSTRHQEFECYKQRLEKRLGESSAGPSRLDGLDEGCSMSEIASCSYEARQAGVKNGMFLGAALKLCPDLRTIPYDFDAYKEVSYTLYNTVAEYTLDIEAVSCDEMFVDCTELLRQAEVAPLEFANVLRREINERTGCTASAGIGPNRLVARLATRQAKPDGQYALESSRVEDFMKDVGVDDLPGVGRSVSSRLRALDVETCGQLRKLPLSELQSQFGQKAGLALYQHCRGQDDRPLQTSGQHQRKSVSAEVNYGIRFRDQAEADGFLRKLSGEVSGRLAEVGMAGRCITLKLMVRAKDAPVETAKFLGHGVCDSITRSCTLTAPTAHSSAIAREVLTLARQIAAPPGEWRGVGIQVSRLENLRGSSSLDSFLSKSRVNVSAGEEVDSQSRASIHPDITLSQVDQSFLDALPEDVRREVEADLSRNKRDKTPELPVDMPLREVQAMLHEWTSTRETPEPYDVYMLADYVERLASRANTEHLSAVLDLLRMCTSEKQDKSWQKACKDIHECAQEIMGRVSDKKVDL